jgi:hypothetical protein
VGQENLSCQDSSGFLRIFFFRRIFSQEPTFGADLKIPVFGHIHRIFSQETGIPVIDPNSSGFLRIPVPAKRSLALASN